MRNRFTVILTLSTLLAFAMLLFLRTEPQGVSLSAPSLGPALVGAAPAPTTQPSTAPAASTKPAASTAPAASGAPTPASYPATGPASSKGDGAPQNTGSTTNVTENWDLRHTPSMDAAAIRQVLQKYNSPAVGAADAMYTLGLEYGIDPAFCLAFFINESTAGTAGVARTTKSVGNIRTTAGYTDYQGYRKYESWEQGIEDWYRLIRDLYIADWGLTTVDQIIPVYAPSSDGNSPDHYIATVKKLVSSWRASH
jgi:hypothetical protein